jgi:HlyD family secretion protein
MEARMNVRNIIIGLGVLTLLAIGFLAFGGTAMIAPKPTPTLNAALADFENLVTASGTLVPAKRANLAFKAQGLVEEILVKPGDVITRGAVLARLNTSEAAAAAAEARANVRQLQAGATKEELAISQANLDTAKAQLAKVRSNATPEDVQIAQASMERAAANLRDAQSQYDRIKDDPQVGMYPQSQVLHLATQEYKIAEARYRQVVKGATPEDIRVAEASVVVAQTNLDRVKSGARSEEIAAAQARLDQASSALSTLTLLAPFDGTVAAVNMREGEVVTPGMTVITLGDLTNLRLETDDLSETNIARVKIGHAADITFEALPGQPFKGKVTFIAPISSAKQGGTNYTIYIELDQIAKELRWGMTGHVEINAKQ